MQQRLEHELKLGLVQAHMAQKPMLRVEVGVRALRARSVSREEAWASAGVQDAHRTDTPILLRGRLLGHHLHGVVGA